MTVSDFRWLLCTLLLCQPGRADELFEGLSPGLVARYTAGELSRSRVEADVAFDWGRAGPLPEFSAAPFTAEWSGTLFVRSDTTYVFSAFARGSVQVLVDGRTVLEATANEPGWLKGPPTPLEFGFLPITIRFAKTAPEALCKLFWSAETFPLEPLPHHLLFHEGDASQARLVERGRVLFDAHRCNKCHVRGDSPPSAEAPPFIAVAADLNPDWLVAKLQHQHAEAADSKMPSYGFTKREATSLAAWLWHINQPPRITPWRKPEGKEKDQPDGLTLVRSVGCLACHKLGELGATGPYGGGDLSHIGAKRTADWLNTWLATPDRINPERQMPLVKLSPTERSVIAAALAELGHNDGMTYERPQFDGNTVLVQEGRELMKKARCYNCHKTPAVDMDTRGLPTLNRPISDWSTTCLSDVADPKKERPFYPQADRAALRAYVETLTQPVQDPQDLRNPAERLGEFNHGRLVLERRNCLACHERDGARGIVETAGRAATTDEKLRGLSEALIPPNLTAVGDKLQDQALAEAVGGDQETVRLPWLKVRMPKFNHTAAERAALTRYFIEHDRIPAATQVPPAGLNANDTPVDSETLLLGRQLVGSGGFSCIACHTVGDYTPRNTALGTRGSDLKGMGRRLREEFYYRWTRAPLRIVPGFEMPSYEERPVKGVLDGDVHAQLALLWKAANDPRFEAPTNPAQVEQLLTIRLGDPPRVVRDVFTVSKENGGGYVPRSFAFGFDNGHSILFDLDTACVRDWTFGDFARQRTEGKSWYWDLAGAPVVRGLTARSEFVLQRGDEWLPLGGAADGVAVVLRDYSVGTTDEPEVRLNYRLRLPGNEPSFVEVRELWRAAEPSNATSRGGLTRSVTVTAASGNENLWLVPAATESLLLSAGIEHGNDWQMCGEYGLGVAAQPTATIVYLADAAVPPAEAAPRPEFPLNTAPVTTAPGFEGTRLPLPTSMMPTALAVATNGVIGVTSLKGHVYVLRDSDGDGTIETAHEFSDGLAAPFGILPVEGATAAPKDWLVVHKPELLALTDHDGDGRADDRRVVASGWGYTDNYHDWSAGPVRDADGNLYVATSSDYAQPGRPEELCQWRGKVLRIAPDGAITPIAHELRYPMGVAFDPQGRLFVSDQQGVANCFNEIDHVVEGGHYGVKGLFDPDTGEPERRAAIQIPHPWTRSVNGIFFIPAASDASPGLAALAPFAGHGIGCEYNNRFLIRFSLQEVDGQLQGATYPFTRTTWADPAQTFLGPMCGVVSPAGDIYIGSIHDSGWLGGLNTGEIVRLRPTGQFPNGIRELRAIPGGFEIEFLRPVDAAAAKRKENYTLSGYTRVWKGSYATEDSGQYQPQIKSIEIDSDQRTVRLHVDRLEPSYVYDVAVKRITADGSELFPDVGYYTMNHVPRE